jgi:peptide/nickel transport system substrate-binding protein
VEGLDKLIDEARSTLNQAHRKRTYSQIQKLIREEAPAIFLWTQYDTLAISKRVDYAARGDEWLWLFDAKPKR